MAQRPPVATQVRIDGLKDLRRDLRAIDRALPRHLNAALREAVRPVASEAAALAPHRSGRLAASLRPFASGSRVGVRTSVPYANVVHWGGTTGRGHTRSHPGATRFPRRAFTLGNGQMVEGYRPFIWLAAARKEKVIVDRVGDAIERLARRHGWH